MHVTVELIKYLRIWLMYEGKRFRIKNRTTGILNPDQNCSNTKYYVTTNMSLMEYSTWHQQQSYIVTTIYYLYNKYLVPCKSCDGFQNKLLKVILIDLSIGSLIHFTFEFIYLIKLTFILSWWTLRSWFILK